MTAHHPPGQQFTIDRVEASTTKGHIDVHVRYDGGMAVFTVPENYPKNTLLSHVRTEIRARMNNADAKARLKSLVGRHDL